MAEEKNNLKTKHDILKWIITCLAGFIVIVLIFGVGVKVGELKARYSYRWAENYHKNFAGPRGGFLDDLRRFPAGDFIGSHGIFGEIIEIKNNSFVVKDRGNIEKLVIINDKTTITKGRKNISASNEKDGLKVGDYVVIIGSPNEEGQIEAKFIRVFSDDGLKPPPQFPFRLR
jgi:hypothetical protein